MTLELHKILRRLPADLVQSIVMMCIVRCISCNRETNIWNICEDCNRPVCRLCEIVIVRVVHYENPTCVLCARVRFIIKNRRN